MLLWSILAATLTYPYQNIKKLNFHTSVVHVIDENQ